MASENSPPGYEVVDSDKELNHIFEVFKDKKLIIHCSTKTSGRHVFESLAFQTPFLVVRPIDNRILRFENREKVVVNFGIDQGLYFLQTDLKLQGKNEYAINFDQKIYKIQRRDNFRLTLPEDYSVEVEFEKSFIPGSNRFKLSNLSQGGMGVSIPQSKSMSVERGRRVDATLYLPDRDAFAIHAVIRHYRDEAEFVQVGFEFEALAPELEQLLGNIMMDLYRLMFSRYRDA